MRMRGLQCAVVANGADPRHTICTARGDEQAIRFEMHLIAVGVGKPKQASAASV
jgi:hypothetical protein